MQQTIATVHMDYYWYTILLVTNLPQRYQQLDARPSMAATLSYREYAATHSIIFTTFTLFQGAPVAIARGCGQCLNFNPTFVIMLMFRRVLTWLRSTRISFLFPLDQSIELHKLVGWTIFFFSCLHTLAHIVNFSKYRQHKNIQ